MARPQGRQSLNVSLSHLVSMSRCLNVSASLLSQVSGLPSPASLALAVQGVACEDRDVEARGGGVERRGVDHGRAALPRGRMGSRHLGGSRPPRALFVRVPHRTHRLTEVAAVVALAEVARIEVEAPRVVREVRNRRRGPGVALRAGIVEARAATVAGSRKEDAPICISALARNEPPVDAVGCDPRGGAIADERFNLGTRRHAPRRAKVRRRRIMRRHKIGRRIDVASREKLSIFLFVGRTRCCKRTAAHLLTRARHPRHAGIVAGMDKVISQCPTAWRIPYRVAPPELVAVFLGL